MDLDVAASGGGYGHTECPQGIPVEFALLSILAAFGVAFGVLYMALTLQTMGRRRRSTGEAGEGEGDGEEQYGGDLAFKFGDLLWAGELLCFGIHNLTLHVHLFWPFHVSCPPPLPSIILKGYFWRHIIIYRFLEKKRSILEKTGFVSTIN